MWRGEAGRKKIQGTGGKGDANPLELSPPAWRPEKRRARRRFGAPTTGKQSRRDGEDPGQEPTPTEDRSSERASKRWREGARIRGIRPACSLSDGTGGGEGKEIGASRQRMDEQAKRTGGGRKEARDGTQVFLLRPQISRERTPFLRLRAGAFPAWRRRQVAARRGDGNIWRPRGARYLLAACQKDLRRRGGAEHGGRRGEQSGQGGKGRRALYYPLGHSHLQTLWRRQSFPVRLRGRAVFSLADMRTGRRGRRCTAPGGRRGRPMLSLSNSNRVRTYVCILSCYRDPSFLTIRSASNNFELRASTTATSKSLRFFLVCI